MLPAPTGSGTPEAVRLGWAGTARQGTAAAPSHGATAHTAPALAAGRGWEQALGVGDAAGKGTRQRKSSRVWVPGLRAVSRGWCEQAGLSCRMKPVLHAFQG